MIICLMMPGKKCFLIEILTDVIFKGKSILWEKNYIYMNMHAVECYFILKKCFEYFLTLWIEMYNSYLKICNLWHTIASFEYLVQEFKNSDFWKSCTLRCSNHFFFIFS